ncbi:MAG: hypothetical protein KGI57_05670 [Hyphomicrobiales bacterium]|nr:hypothetical protein [Hyphomicrobiales bacterium]MDE2017176.1 hypothetical protein [Hyphomicrobiales bacterium]
MKNITLAVEDDVLDRARVAAAKRKTTVNALVREFLTEVGSAEDRLARARRELLELAAKSEFRIGPDWKFDRDEAHER